VGVHAVAAENVWTRDLNVDPTMRFLNSVRKGCCADTAKCEPFRTPRGVHGPSIERCSRMEVETF
jgi:hypothetical protein